MMASESPPPATPTLERWWVDLLWLALLAAWSAAWCLTASPRIGATYDEPRYLEVGLEDWREWYCWRSTSEGIMPLPPEMCTIPLRIYEKRTGTLLFTEEEMVTKLHGARAVTLGWLLLLIISAWRLGRTAGGVWAGRIAAGLIAADPTVLGHATLATTDVATAAALMAFARAVFAGRSGGWWKRILLPGLWYGVAVLCKLSALLYGGLILVAFEVCYRFANGHLSPPGGGLGPWVRRVAGAVIRSVLAAAVVIVIGATIALLYCGRPEEGGKKPLTHVSQLVPPHEPLADKYKELAAKYQNDRVPHALGAFAFQWWRDSVGRPTFVNGTYYPNGYRYYFPLMIAMKVPLPVFVLAALLVIRPRAMLNPFALAALLMLGALLSANLQIGVRLAMPVIAMGYIAVAVGVARAYPQCAKWFGAVAVLTIMATSVWVWPHGLCYVNQAFGGLEAAPRQMTDSNLDWGQGIPDLVAWREANSRPPVVIWYFGTDPAAKRDPFRVIPMESLAINSEGDLRTAVGPNVLAVSYTVISLQPDAPPAKVNALAYLQTKRPLARTATFVLYDFRDPSGSPPLD
ncbi:MAG: hypothetical protein L0241_23345 [Planctomycetia bacterium]|nr:hypothetical protein [Planctomycetia bacterium]